MTHPAAGSLFALVIGCAAQPIADPTPAVAPTPEHAGTPSTAIPNHVQPPSVSPPAPVPAPAPKVGCWERLFGAPPAAHGLAPSLPDPIEGCDGCESLRAGPNTAGLHPGVLTKLLAIQRARPAPEVDEPLLWVNSGHRDGNAAKSMHNQGLAIDVVVCGLDSPGTAALLREAGFTCVIEYYDPEGKPCNMAHGDLRNTPLATSAYAPGGRKADTCPERAVSKGEDCQGSTKADWAYTP